MLAITDRRSLARALNTSLDPKLKRLLTDRIRQLDVEDLTTAARFVIVQPGDTVTDLDQALSFSILENVADGSRFGNPDYSPGWEWMEDHGFAFELVFIFTEDGFAHVVFVPRKPGINPDLLNFCATYAGEHVSI